MKSFLLAISLILGAACPVLADELSVQDDMDRINYSLGFQIGSDLKGENVEIREAVLLKGLQDAVTAQKPLLTKAEMRDVLVDLKQRVVQAEQKRREQSLVEGQAFLHKNATVTGVVERPSGLQYLILKEGHGQSPVPTDQVRVQYRGLTLEGREFDSSYRDGQPVEFPLTSVIPGWQEAIPLMKEGATWKLFLPPDLAFGERGPLADQVVIYELELVAILPK